MHAKNKIELFINSHVLGETYVGTREQFKALLEPHFRVWFAESDSECSYEEWVENALDEGLEPATDEDIWKHPRL